MTGNHQKVTEKYLEILLETIEKEPEELGYEFGRWSAQRLATYLEERTGIKLSGSQVRRILSRKKYVYLWAKYSLESKRNPQNREAFIKKITEYLKIEKETPELLQVWFWALDDTQTRKDWWIFSIAAIVKISMKFYRKVTDQMKDS